MKFLGKISAIALVILIIGVSTFAQNAQQSRLDVGKEAKVVSPPKSNNFFFNAIPSKLNFNSKTEYTRFYRNLLLKTNDTKAASTGDNKAANKVAEVSNSSGEKVKFGNIYPNPANSFANIDYEVLSKYSNARVTVLNLVGSSLLEYPVGSNSSRIRLNTSSLESGIYMVQFVVDNKKVATQKLLVERK